MSDREAFSLLSLLEKEITRYDYSSYDTVLNEYLSSWRRKCVVWMYNVIDHFHLSRDLVIIATWYTDRILLFQYIHTSRELILVILASIRLADKLYGFSHGPFTDSLLIALGKHEYTSGEFAVMECDILQCLHWFVHPPTSICFLKAMVHTLMLHPDVYESCSDLIYQASTKPTFMNFRQSLIAYASILRFKTVTNTDIDVSILNSISVFQASVDDILDVTMELFSD